MAEHSGEFSVVVLTGDHAGDEVTFGGVPWRGSLAAARRIQADMHSQAERFGHQGVTYGIEAQAPQGPCSCGHGRSTTKADVTTRTDA